MGTWWPPAARDDALPADPARGAGAGSATGPDRTGSGDGLAAPVDGRDPHGARAGVYLVSSVVSSSRVSFCGLDVA